MYENQNEHCAINVFSECNVRNVIFRLCQGAQYCSLPKQSKTTSADPDRGGAFPDRPGKSQVIWVSIGNKQLELSPWKKLDLPGKC